MHRSEHMYFPAISLFLSDLVTCAHVHVCSVCRNMCAQCLCENLCQEYNHNCTNDAMLMRQPECGIYVYMEKSLFKAIIIIIIV